MNRQDLHTHSTFDDGKSTLEEMVHGAMTAGLSAIGLSGHSPLPYDDDWAIPASRFPAYLAEARRLREAYAGRFPVYLGLEWDVISDPPAETFDYVIGSVHHLPVETGCTVDESSEVTNACLQRYFGGDAAAMEEVFYGEYGKIAAQPAVDIVGHFDLITKFDEARVVFHHFPPCAEAAMERLVQAEKIFEINTGAVSRGYRQTPYPSARALRRLRELGGRITLSSDAHHRDGLGFGFPAAAELARSCGFRELWQFNGREFVPVKL